MAQSSPPERRDSDEKPPIFPTWNGWYALVLATLAAVVALFTLLARHYR